MNTEERLIKVQARLDAILYKDNSIKPNLDDYSYPTELPINLPVSDKPEDRSWIVSECLVLLFVIADHDLQQLILDHVDSALHFYANDFYYQICTDNPFPTNDKWKEVHCGPLLPKQVR